MTTREQAHPSTSRPSGATKRARTDSFHHLRACDVMTAPAVACRDQAFFEEAAEILADYDISGMPVVDGSGRVVGVLSERDLAYALGGPMVRLALRRHNPHAIHRVAELPREARRVKDIMTTPALMVPRDAPLQDVARLMRLRQINRIPVVDGERLVGLVTRGDVLGAIAHLGARSIDPAAPPVLIGSSGLYGSPAGFVRGDRR